MGGSSYLSGAELAEFIVKKGMELGFDEVAALASRLVRRQVRFAKSKVTLLATQDVASADVMVCKDGRIQTGSITDISKGSLESALSYMRAMVHNLKPHESYSQLPEGPFKYDAVQGIYDARIGKLRDECIDMAERAIRASEEEGAKEVAGTLYADERHDLLRTSRGVEAYGLSTLIRMEVRASSDVCGEKVYGLGLSCSRTLDAFDPDGAGRRAGRKVKLSTRIMKAEEGEFDAILDRPAFAVLVSEIGKASSAFFVISGLSFLEGRIGDRVAPSGISIIDDPRMEGGIGSRSFDYEGMPTRTNPIIEDGILRTYLHNRLTAKKFKVESTANAGWIVPTPWNMVVSPGEISDDKLVEEMVDGIFITNITYVRFTNLRTGEFSSIIRDGVFRVEKGEITGHVKGLRLADSLARMLGNIEYVSSSTEPTYHWWMEAGVPAYVPMAKIAKAKFTLPTK